jgi:hypothetical protein
METGKRVQAIRRGLLIDEKAGVMASVKGIPLHKSGFGRNLDLKGHGFRRPGTALK